MILGTSKCIHSIEYNVEIPQFSRNRVLVMRKFQIMLKNEEMLIHSWSCQKRRHLDLLVKKKKKKKKYSNFI